MLDEEYLTIKDICALTGMGETTVRNMVRPLKEKDKDNEKVKAKKILAYRIDGKYRVRKSDWEDYINRHRSNANVDLKAISLTKEEREALRFAILSGIDELEENKKTLSAEANLKEIDEKIKCLEQLQEKLR